MQRKDLTGQRFGRLTVLEYAGAAKNGNACWKCQCDCGNIKVVDGYRLRKGTTTSCGCYRRDLMRVAIMENPKTREQMGRHGQFASSEGVNIAAATKRRTTNRSGVIGVSFDKQTKKWNARLFIKGKLVLNKQFVDFKDAEAARKQAEAQYLQPLIARMSEHQAATPKQEE